MISSDRHRNVSVRQRVVVGLSTIILVAAGTSAVAQRRPEALAVTPRGDLLVLDSAGRIWRTDSRQRELRVDREGLSVTGREPLAVVGMPEHARELLRDRSVLPFGPTRALGLALVESGGETEMVVTGYERTSGGANVLYVSRLGRASERPHVERVVSLGLFAGVAADPDGSKLYLTNTRTAEIYTFPLTGKPSLQRFAQPADAVVLGPLVVDDTGQRLYVADVARGALLAVDAEPEPGSKPASREIASGLGEPIALAYDAARRRILVADASGRQVWMIDPEGRNEPVPLALDQDLSEPVALLVTPAGDLVVADAEPPAIYFFTGIGGATRTVLRF